jgi:hypothetical protein
MTRVGRVSYERIALVPSSRKDADRLKGLGVFGNIYPVDEVLGLSRLPFKITVGAMLEIAKESTRCESYEDAEQILKERTSIQINDDTMRHVTNTLGTIVFNNDIKIAESIWNGLNSGKLPIYHNKFQDTLYIEVDGAMLPTRDRDKNGIIYRENKLGMVFSSDNFFYWTDNKGKRQHRIEKREYTPFIGEVDTFTKLIFSLAMRNGYGKYKSTVLISDGATWIRNMKNYIFPDVQQILDFYHLKEHIIDYAKQIFKFNEVKYLNWSKNICDLFKESKTSEAITLIIKISRKKDKISLEKLLNYINNNIDNIDYKYYLSKNFFIGSGAIESSNKTVLQRRLKYGAMRWNLSSGQAVLSLVAKTRSGLWESDVVQAAYSHYGEPYPSVWPY